MLPTSQLKSSGIPYSNPNETSTSTKSEITLPQIEEARASGCLHVKNCNIEYLPQLPSEITSIIVQ